MRLCPSPNPRSSLCALAVVAGLSACAPDDAGPIVPVAGHWTVTGETVGEDTCDLVSTFGETGMPAGLVVDEVRADGFTVIPDDDTERLACALDGSGAFSCDSYQESDSGSQSGGSYTLTYTWGTAGTLQGDAAMILDATMDLSCDGNMCGQIADSYDLDFPCHLAASRELVAD